MLFYTFFISYTIIVNIIDILLIKWTKKIITLNYILLFIDINSKYYIDVKLKRIQAAVPCQNVNRTSNKSKRDLNTESIVIIFVLMFNFVISEMVMQIYRDELLGIKQ